MNDERSPNVEDIKIRLGNEIPIDEEPADTESLKAEEQQPDIVVELSNLGRQFADTLQTAWNSQERQKFEAEIREGMKSFADEMDKAFQEIKKSPVTQKAKEEATTIKTKVEAGEVTQKTKSGLAQGLNWLSEELAKLANQFTPAEKTPEDLGQTSEE
jgi:hypothetical protein